MAIMYKARQAKIANKEGKKLWHPAVVLSGTCNLAQLARECAEMSSLSTGDVKNTVDNLIITVNRHLLAGESVSLDGLGSFTPALRSLGKGSETEAGVNASNARMKINFRESTTRNIDRTVATRSLSQGASFVRIAGTVNPGDIVIDDGTGGSGNDNGGGSGNTGGDNTGGSGGTGGSGDGGME